MFFHIRKWIPLGLRRFKSGLCEFLVSLCLYRLYYEMEKVFSGGTFFIEAKFLSICFLYKIF